MIATTPPELFSCLSGVGRFSAVDAKTGKLLWKTRLGTSVQGYPVSFAIDGKQYIAVTTSLSGGSRATCLT